MPLYKGRSRETSEKGDMWKRDCIMKVCGPQSNCVPFEGSKEVTYSIYTIYLKCYCTKSGNYSMCFQIIE